MEYILHAKKYINVQNMHYDITLYLEYDIHKTNYCI